MTGIILWNVEVARQDSGDDTTENVFGEKGVCLCLRVSESMTE